MIRYRKNQSNFQLVVITHDEDFVSLLGRSEHASHYFRVDKRMVDGDTPHTVIEQLPIEGWG